MRDVRQEAVLELQLLFLTDFEGAQKSLPFDGVADGALEVLARDIALDQVVLNALMDRLHRQDFIVLAGKHNDRNVGRVLHDPAKRIGAAAVGKVQIQQHDGRRFPVQEVEAGRQPGDAIHVDRSLAFDQAQAYQVGVAEVIFNQQYVRGRLAIHYSPYSPILPGVAGLPNRTRILRWI